MVKNDKYYRDKLMDDIDFIIEHIRNQTQESNVDLKIVFDTLNKDVLEIKEMIEQI